MKVRASVAGIAFLLVAFSGFVHWLGPAICQDGVKPNLAPASRREVGPDSDYEVRLNAALQSRLDLWGEQVIRDGDATYDGLKDLLQPLYYSTGETNTEYGPHTVLFGDDGGQPPYVVAGADGHRLYANQVSSGKRIEIEIGEGDEWHAFAGGLPGSEFPQLEGGYYPILRTRHTTQGGVQFIQTTFAARVTGVEHLLGMTTIEVSGVADSLVHPVRFRLRGFDAAHLRTQPAAPIESDVITLTATANQPLCLLWSPQDSLPPELELDAALARRCKQELKARWDERIAVQPFDVPEPIVMDALRNLLIQNLVLRWRYSLGSAVYHNDFYQPESSDACSLLAKYGFPEAARDGLQSLLGKSDKPDGYSNWEMGEKLSHAAEYYHLTGDAEFIRRNTPEYLKIVDVFAGQIKHDPRGLLEPQRFSADQAYQSYAVFQLTVCWRGMRDMRIVWERLGMAEAVAACGKADADLRQALQTAIAQNATVLPDGSLFIPCRLFEDVPIFDPITETRDGSYWNLVMPYAFSSGFWPADSPVLDGVSRYIHRHGGTFLGMTRFNYYPLAIGAHRREGLPGYSTTGVDNVYSAGYIRFLSDRDEVDRLILSFYGLLAHGMTRGTFISGEGDTLGANPDYNDRSSYGSSNSANNTGKLLALRQMLVRESFDFETGLPQGLYLTHATPRPWLENGKVIRINNAITAFGPVSCTITSQASDGHVTVHLVPPPRHTPNPLRIRIRLPGKLRIVSIEGTPDGIELQADGETIELRHCVAETELRLNVVR